jgi:hypothetical protein
MHYAFAVVAVSFLAVSPPAQARSATPYLIVPGKSFGAITARTTLNDLIRIYGRKNVRVGMLQPPHGDFPKQRGAVIHEGTVRAVEVYFKERTNRVERVVVRRGSASAWRTREGLRTGIGLAELERILGGPFPISSYGRDGGGSIVRGRNAAAIRGLYIRLSYPGKVSRADMLKMSSGKPFMSNNPAARRARLRVTVIWWDAR